jgi:phosphonate transport system substrate-binding protein
VLRFARSQSCFAMVGCFLWLLCCGMSLAAEPGVLHFGVFPRWNAQQMVREFTPLAQQLSQATGLEVRIETEKDFDAFMRRVYAREFDLVHLNHLQLLRAQARAGYHVIAGLCETPECTVHALIVVRADSGLKDIGELRGKAVAFGGRDAMVSHVMSRELLRRRGLPPEQYTTVFANNPLNALLTVYNGESQAAGLGEGVLQNAEITRHIDVQALRILAESDPVPPLPVAVRDDLDPKLVNALLEELLTLGDTPGGADALEHIGARRFTGLGDSDYESLKALAETLDHGQQ